MADKSSDRASSYLRPVQDGVNVTVRAKPGAKRNSISFESPEYVKVSINAPPVEGRANIELVSYLSEIFGIPKSSVQLLRGGSSRNKIVFLRGVGAAEFHERTAKFAK